MATEIDRLADAINRQSQAIAALASAVSEMLDDGSMEAPEPTTYMDGSNATTASDL